MPDTKSLASQDDPLRMVEDSTLWECERDPIRNPIAALPALSLTTLTIAPPSHVPGQAPATISSDQAQAPATTAEWRAELKARYKAMPNTAWFRAAHEGRSLGESTKLS